MVYRPHITDAQQLFSDEELIALMPKNFAFVAKLIGIKPALSLIESYGGILVFVPHKHALGIHHDLSQIIGYSKLQLLSEHLGNTSIEVPMATTITIAMRNRTIREMAAKKESRSKIARKFGVTIRTIRHIVNGEEKLKFHLDQNLIYSNKKRTKSPLFLFHSMKNLFKVYPTQSHLIPLNPIIISSLLYIYIIRYHLCHPKVVSVLI